MKFIDYYEHQNAKSRSASLGASVPLPRNGNENEDYLVAVNEIAWHGFGVPLGLNDVATEGVWRDNNGNRVTYTNWRSGQPDGGDYVFMYTWMNDGTWADHYETDNRPIVCEIEPN